MFVLFLILVLILSDLGNIIFKKAKRKRKRRVKSTEDQILSISETDQFHEFF